MKPLLMLSLLASALAFVPAADATVCDPVTGQVCANSYGAGECDNGNAGNDVSYYDDDGSGYTYVGVGTHCAGSPGTHSVSSIRVTVFACDAEWNCDQAGAHWAGGHFSGNPYCSSAVQAFLDGQRHVVTLPLCLVGAPPGIPALLP